MLVDKAEYLISSFIYNNMNVHNKDDEIFSILQNTLKQLQEYEVKNGNN